MRALGVAILTPALLVNAGGRADARVSSAACPSRSTRAIPDGPSDEARIVQSGGDGQPEISMVRYPRPDEPGDPWSQWGQGLALPDGRYVSAIGDERGADGNSYVFVYDPASRQMTRIGDVASRIRDAGWSGGYGKIHGQIVPGRCGDAYFATYWGAREEVEYSSTYRGDVLFHLDPATLEFEVVGVPVESRGIPSLAGRGKDGLIYGEAADPKPETPSDHELGAFFAYDVSKRKVVFRSDDPRHSLFRNVMIDSKGRAYVASENGRLLVYERGAQELRELPVELPGGGSLRASTRPGPDGTVYGVTQASESEDSTDATLFALDPDGNVRSLGKAGGYTTSLALSRDGTRIYYVPGAYGDSADQGTPVFSVDTTDRRAVDRGATQPARGGAPRPHARRQLQRRPRHPAQPPLCRPECRTHARRPVGRSCARGGGSRRVKRLGSRARRRAAFATLVIGLYAMLGGLHRADARSASPTASSCSRITYRAPSAGAPEPIQFSDATREWGFEAPLTGMLGHATAAGDVDGDGWTDVFVGTFADRPIEDYQVRGADGPSPDRLLRGGPHGFTPDPDFPAVLGRTSGATFADLDRDGDLDLVVARNVRDSDRGRAPSEILANVDGKFERATTLPQPVGARSIGVLDYDGDGRLDLFIAEDRWTNASSVLLRNEGGLRFTNTTTDSGIPDDVVGMGVATADLDGNGAPDLFVGGSNRIFLNNGAGSFDEGNSSAFRWEVYGDEDDPAGVTVGDFNRDGRPDLVIGQHYNSTIDDGRRVPIRLYTNEGMDEKGNLAFREDTEASGLVGLPTKSPHVEVADFDNDGWPDILTTASAADRVTPIVFRNLGESGNSLDSSRTQHPAPSSTGLPEPSSTRTTTGDSTSCWSSGTRHGPPSFSATRAGRVTGSGSSRAWARSSTCSAPVDEEMRTLAWEESPSVLPPDTGPVLARSRGSGSGN